MTNLWSLADIRLLPGKRSASHRSPTHSPAGPKRALTLRTCYSPNCLEEFSEVRVDRVLGSSNCVSRPSMWRKIHFRYTTPDGDHGGPTVRRSSLLATNGLL